MSLPLGCCTLHLYPEFDNPGRELRTRSVQAAHGCLLNRRSLVRLPRGPSNPGPVKRPIVQSNCSGIKPRTPPPTWSRGRDGFGIPRELRQLFESVRESMSSALEYVKKLVLVFVEELPGFEFFVQDGRV